MKDRAQGAAGGAAARRWTEDVAVRARAALAYQPRGRPPSNVVRPEQPYDVAARALSALRDDEPYRNPRVVQDYGMESDEEANSKATPPPKCRRGCVGRRRRSRRPISRPKPPPSVGWVVLLVGGVCFDRRWQNPGENRTARKRCRFFTGNSRGWRFKRGNRTGRKRCRFFSRRRLRPFRVGGRGRPQGHASPGRQQVLPWDS